MAKLADVRRAGTLLSDEFIGILEHYFPDRMPDPFMTDKEIHVAIGNVQVIRTIKHWKEQLDDPEQAALDEELTIMDMN